MMNGKHKYDVGFIIKVFQMGRKSTKNIGDRFGELEIIELISSNQSGKHVKAKCLCHNCQTVKVINSSYLHKRVSCGCLQRDSDKWKSKGPHNKPWQLPKGEAARRNLEYQYKKSASIRKLEYKLTTEEFNILIIGKCVYCGNKDTNIKKGQGKTSGDFIYTGIDRISSSKGYTVDNCVSCCWVCNNMKGSLNEEDFKNHVFKISNNLNNKSA